MRLAGRPQQQRRRVHGTARHDDERRLDSTRLAVPVDFDRLDLPARGIGQQASREGVGPEGHGRLLQRLADAADLGVALRVDLARKRVTRVAEHATARLARPQYPERQRRRVQPQALELLDDRRDGGRVRHRLVRIRRPRRLRRIHAMLSAHVVQLLRSLVVRLERLVRDRPRRRDTVCVLDRLEVLATQPIEDAAPELRVAADAIVRVRPKRPAASIEPSLGDAVAKVLPHRLRIPVFVFLRDEITTFENEDAGGRTRQRLSDRPAAGPAADDDDVEAFVPHREEGRAPSTGPPSALRPVGRWRQSDP